MPAASVRGWQEGCQRDHLEAGRGLLERSESTDALEGDGFGFAVGTLRLCCAGCGNASVSLRFCCAGCENASASLWERWRCLLLRCESRKTSPRAPGPTGERWRFLVASETPQTRRCARGVARCRFWGFFGRNESHETRSRPAASSPPIGPKVSRWRALPAGAGDGDLGVIVAHFGCASEIRK